jgi:membrane fusion protein (multidrug efflux system)
MTPLYKLNQRVKNCTCVLMVITIAACNQPVTKTAAADSATVKTDSVKVFILTQDSAKRSLSLPGELLANENAEIHAKTQGYIRKLNVDIGSTVHKGQVLALINAPEVGINVQQLTEKASAARSRYLSSKDYFDRLSIAAQSDGVISGSELQRTKNQFLADSADYKAAVLGESSSRQLGNYLAIVAPYSGTITKRNIVVGSYVGAPNEPPLFELENNQVLRLQVAVPEVYTGASLVNNTGEITTRSAPDKKFKAALVRASGTIDPATRSEVWEFEVINAGGELKAGSYADVKLQFMRAQPSLALPISAVLTTLEKKFVIRVASDTTQWVDVRSGFNLGDRQEVFGNVKSGDTLVGKPTEELKPGTKVKLKW